MDKRQKLPFLTNVHIAIAVVVFLCIATLAAQSVLNVDFGDGEWALIGGVATKLMDIAFKITDYYTSGDRKGESE